MNIGIVGGGFTGLTAAYDLLQAGHEVQVFEAGNRVGGLASGFRRPGWDWTLEKFYHHIFSTDRAIIDLTRRIGAADLLFFTGQTTAFFCEQHGIHPVTIPSILRTPHLPPIDRVRYLASLAQLKLRRDWQRLERVTAADHLRRWAGPRAYRHYWEPLLAGKFGPHAEQINAAWIWARVKTRSFKLGYFRGGFQALADALAAEVQRQGGTIFTRMPVQRVEQIERGWRIVADGAEQTFDRVIVASSPQVFGRVVGALPETYLRSLNQLEGMGAVVMVLALDRQLLTNGVYWLMPPKPQFPFLALVEHTNMVDAHHYGGDHLVYCGDYLPTNHRYFAMDADAIMDEWSAALPQARPNFDPAWIRERWLFRERYAQPVVPVNHSRNVPALQTPLPGLFFASLAHVYPWDRGTNFAVELGQRVAREVLASA